MAQMRRIGNTADGCGFVVHQGSTGTNPEVLGAACGELVAR